MASGAVLSLQFSFKALGAVRSAEWKGRRRRQRAEELVGSEAEKRLREKGERAVDAEQRKTLQFIEVRSLCRQLLQLRLWPRASAWFLPDVSPKSHVLERRETKALVETMKALVETMSDCSFSNEQG